jgi:hypothetical protein
VSALAAFVAVPAAALAVAERHRPQVYGSEYVIDSARLVLHRQPKQLEVISVAYDCFVGGWTVNLSDDELRAILKELL